MKRWFALLLCTILILTGCSIKEQPQPTIPQMAPEAVPTTVPEVTTDSEEVIPSESEMTELLCISVPAETETYAIDDGTVLFTYTAQHMQLLLPNEEVADRVILDFLNRVDFARSDAEDVLAAAQNDYTLDTEWFPYFYQILFSPTRIDHDVLSLFGTQNSYSGGIHGSVSCVSANYDLATGDILTLGSIMHMDATKEQFIELIIDKLSDNAEELQLFEGFEEGVYHRLGGDENLYEDFYFTATGLTFFFAPYEIAPYSAGVITVEIPYNELPGLIYDGYFPAERELKEGRILSNSFMQTDMEQFNNMFEVNIDSGEGIMVVYPEGNVEDVRIRIPGDGMNLPEYTVFAALEMSAQNAIVISAAQDKLDEAVVSYRSEESVLEIPLIQ